MEDIYLYDTYLFSGFFGGRLGTFLDMQALEGVQTKCPASMKGAVQTQFFTSILFVQLSPLGNSMVWQASFRKKPALNMVYETKYPLESTEHIDLPL